MTVIIYPCVIVSHLKTSNCINLKYFNVIQGILNVFNWESINLYFIKISKISDEYDFPILLGIMNHGESQSDQPY